MINISISTNFLIILSFFVLFIIIGVIAYIIYKDKKVDQDEIDDLLDDIVKAKPRKEVVTVKKIEPTTEKKPIDLEAMLNKMQSDLEKKEQDEISKFEDDQEKNAIISYKELVKANDNKELVEDYEKEQERKSIINFNEINGLDNLEEKEDLLKNSLKKTISKIESPREERDKKFKNTDFISPIYGKMDEHINYPKIKAYDKYDDLNVDSYFGENVEYETNNSNEILNENGKNDDFLRELKKFRSNL